ncbi:MAG: hypothetical protein ABIW79_04375 [Gemmatimonas sp.]
MPPRQAARGNSRMPTAVRASPKLVVRLLRRAAALSSLSLLSFAAAMPAQDSTVIARAARDSAARDSALRTKPRALAELLADASRRNVLPRDLIAYKAQVETELSLLVLREQGTESVAAVEDVASSLRWTRSGAYDQRVTGYRAQRVGFSMLTVMQTGWLNPTLYGNRLRIRTRAAASAAGAARESMRRDGLDTLPAVHPLATDRDNFYRYSGGDTVVTLRVGDRDIPIVYVRVQPRDDVRGRVLLFDGELALDASRGALVKLRGHFVRVNESRGFMQRLIEAVAFIEYENAEHEGRFWLPSRQRIELQATSPLAGEGRAVVRIVSRFRQVLVNDTTLDAITLVYADSLRALGRRRLTYAPRDSIDAYDRWIGTLGQLTQGMHGTDFDDIGPDRWRTTGAPRLDITTPRGSDILHFNRVEGLFTGAGARLALRDAAPGIVLRASAGWAWSEGTARGRASVDRTRGLYTLGLRGERTLDNTNDFRTALDSGPSVFSAFGSRDPYDYVDRRAATLSLVRDTGANALSSRLDVGVGDDRYRPSTYVRGPFGGDPYRANRGVDEGGYLRSALVVDWHPDVSAEFLKPGVGARVSYERGDGTLSWQRTEARLTTRRLFGPFTAVARGDVGVVTGARIPPQQLFELGERQGLPGYEDKEFAGSRAAIVRGQLLYLSNWLQRPIRVGRRLMLPGIAPGASVGLQSGWTELPNAAARESLLRLGLRADSTGAMVPVARATDGFRATATAGLRFFSGSLFVGAARPVDQAAKWKTLIVFGQQW